MAGVTLYAKAEWKNPGGSVKDRPAQRMICEGLRRNQLTPGRRILDATSGNTGIAYAMIGAALGYGVTLCVPENITPERKRILRTYGAELIFTDPLEGSDGAIREAQRRFAADPDRYFYPDQYNNEFNWRAHYDTTAAEIWDQTDGRVTHFVAGLGTSGTFVGTGRRLRELNDSIVLASVQPDSPLHGLEGLKHMESAIVPGIYDPHARRRRSAREHRSLLRDDATAGRGRRVAGRHFKRRQSGRRPRARESRTARRHARTPCS